MNLSTLSFLDMIEVSESYTQDVSDSQPENGDGLRMEEGLTLTITDGGDPIVKKYK